MWDLPRPWLEPVSPALAGRFSTTAPPGKPKIYFISNNFPHFLEWACVVFIYSYKIYDYVQRKQMHILLLTKNHCFYLVVPISGPFLTHFVLYAWGLAARSSSWPQLATTPTATLRWRLFILSFYRYENRSSERLSNLSEVTQQWGVEGLTSESMPLNILLYCSILVNIIQQN